MTKILVVEDEKMLREGIAEILTFEGYNVIQAENGEVGLLAAFRHIPDLILSDIMMPVMDGHEFLYMIRTNDSTKLIPFIFMTALAERSDQRTGMELGSDDYITKPYTRDELLTSVSTQLRKSGDVKEIRESTLNELRAKIISHLPHELRTPLNGILGLGQMMMDYPDTLNRAEIPEIGKTIYESAMRLSRLVQNYIIYMQLELKNSTPKLMITLKDLDKLCERIALETALRYNRTLDLKLNVSESVVNIGATELTKILEELIDNAFKFSTTGTIVNVSCWTKGGRFILTIEDEGYGMCDADISRIGAYMQFERNLNEQQGSGLGLVIAKRLIEMYNGNLFIKSAKNEGTSVLVNLPGNGF